MRGTSTPTVGIATNVITTTNFTYSGNSYYGGTDSLTVTNIQAGSNYWSVWSDSAGSVTSFVAVVAVPQQPANVVANAGSNAVFTVPSLGSLAPTYQWQTNGVNLANGTKYTNVTTVSLTVSNVNSTDALRTYDCVVGVIQTNLSGLLYLTTTTQSYTTTPVTLTLSTAPTSATVTPAATTNLWGSSTTFTVTPTGGNPAVFTYQWKKSGVNISGATKSTLTFNPTVTTNAASYTCGVTNSAGGVLSSAGVLTVSVPPPTFTGISVNGTSVVMGFGSTNSSDTTNAFKLFSSPVVTGPYTNNTSASFTTNGSGGFIVTAPQTSSTNMFYILEHNP
jgi:Immunoglobulin I-set domain